MTTKATPATDSYPEPGTRWVYKGDPARLYEVMHITNVAKTNEDLPPQVIYRTCSRPGNIWSRSVDSFMGVFTPQTPREEPEPLGKRWRVTLEITKQCTFEFVSEYDWPEGEEHRISDEAIRLFDRGRIPGEIWSEGRGSSAYVVDRQLAPTSPPDD